MKSHKIMLKTRKAKCYQGMGNSFSFFFYRVCLAISVCFMLNSQQNTQRWLKIVAFLFNKTTIPEFFISGVDCGSKSSGIVGHMPSRQRQCAGLGHLLLALPAPNKNWRDWLVGSKNTVVNIDDDVSHFAFVLCYYAELSYNQLMMHCLHQIRTEETDMKVARAQ